MLTARFNIPVEKLSFEHIAELRNNKESERELEKIIKILESGELGYFPELLERARDKLVQVNKHHALVRAAPAPVEKLQALDPRQVTRLRSELNEWCSEMKERQPQVVSEEMKGKKGRAATSGLNVRGHLIYAPNKNSKKTKARIKSCDYAAWDRFDADVEIKNMDASVERKKTRLRRQELRKQLKSGNTVDEKPCQTVEEKSFADTCRLKGNAAYKAGKYQDALKLYTESIRLASTATCLSNRAQVHLKTGQFSAALQDCEEALRLDPQCIKAVYRKALALFHLKRHDAAIDWFGRFLKEEPNNKTAHGYLSKLHNSVPVTLRFRRSLDSVPNGDAGKEAPKIVVLDEGRENSSETMKKLQQNSKETKKQQQNQISENVEDGEPRNEWGFQKQVYVPTRRGLPKFMVQYEKCMKSKTGTRRKTSTASAPEPLHESQSSEKLADKAPRGEVQNARAESDRCELLDVNDDYTPKSIVNIVGGTNKPFGKTPPVDKPVGKAPRIEVILNKEKASKEGGRVKFQNSLKFEE